VCVCVCVLPTFLNTHAPTGLIITRCLNDFLVTREREREKERERERERDLGQREREREFIRNVSFKC